MPSTRPYGTRRRTARLLVIGGEPFDEHIVMWWNFVGRDHEDIVTAWDDWVRADTRFGTVHGYHGDRLPAPPLLVVRLVAARGGEGEQGAR